jgi:hypothetical protein
VCECETSPVWLVACWQNFIQFHAKSYRVDLISINFCQSAISRDVDKDPLSSQWSLKIIKMSCTWAIFLLKVIIIFLSSIRSIEICYGRYKTESFHIYKGILTKSNETNCNLNHASQSLLSVEGTVMLWANCSISTPCCTASIIATSLTNRLHPSLLHCSFWHVFVLQMAASWHKYSHAQRASYPKTAVYNSGLQSGVLAT